MFLFTDLGHDPDDAIALSYLIEHNKYPSIIILFPGFDEQVRILSTILTSYEIEARIYTAMQKFNTNYFCGKHQIFLSKNKMPSKPISQTFKVNEALIIGPPLNLGGKLESQMMVFQGGFSPNSFPPLPKFENVTAVSSHNPCNAINDFNQLLESDKIKNKYYVGKNVCHGFTKVKLSEIWTPKNPSIREFWDSLDDQKAMHDVLAAQCLLNPTHFSWENAKPIWFGNKLSTIPTNENIWTLI